MAKKCAWCGSHNPRGGPFGNPYCCQKCEYEAKQARKKK